MRDIKNLYDKIELDGAKSNAIRSELLKTKKKNHIWAVPMIAVLAACVLIMVIPYAKEHIVNAEYKSRRNIVVMYSGKSLEVVINPETGSVKNFYDINRYGSGVELAKVKDGRLYMVLDDEWIDVTDYCSATSYYRYEVEKQNGIKEVIIVGGVPEDNKFGWIDYLYDANGNQFAYISHAPCSGSYCEADWSNEDFDWLDIARHDEGETCHDPECTRCN